MLIAACASLLLATPLALGLFKTEIDSQRAVDLRNLQIAQQEQLSQSPAGQRLNRVSEDIAIVDAQLGTTDPSQTQPDLISRWRELHSSYEEARYWYSNTYQLTVTATASGLGTLLQTFAEVLSNSTSILIVYWSMGGIIFILLIAPIIVTRTSRVQLYSRLLNASEYYLNVEQRIFAQSQAAAFMGVDPSDLERTDRKLHAIQRALHDQIEDLRNQSLYDILEMEEVKFVEDVVQPWGPVR